MTTADKLAGALRELADAENDYRIQHDLHGEGDMRVGRAWDKMRRAGDRARNALAVYDAEQAKAGTQVEMLSPHDLCRLSRLFDSVSYGTGQDQRINDWLQSALSTSDEAERKAKH